MPRAGADKTKSSFQDTLDFPLQNSAETVLSLEQSNILLHVFIGLWNGKGHPCLVH